MLSAVPPPPETSCTRLSVGGLQPFTTIDFPGCLSAVIFCQGCQWRCTYCHNVHLQAFAAGTVPWEEIQTFLESRRGLLDAVVFSGGEPTAQSALPAAIREIRGMGFRAGLHTAGMYPDRLSAILPDLDWVGFDVKAPFDHRYDQLTQREAVSPAVKESLCRLLASGVDYQIRTTLDPAHFDDSAREALEAQLSALGAKPTKWQVYRDPKRS